MKFGDLISDEYFVDKFISFSSREGNYFMTREMVTAVPRLLLVRTLSTFTNTDTANRL